MNFKVCSEGGDLAHFKMTAFHVSGCQLGFGGGGYSVPYDVELLYVGHDSFNGSLLSITSSENCSSSLNGSLYEFVALGEYTVC